MYTVILFHSKYISDMVFRKYGIIIFNVENIRSGAIVVDISKVHNTLIEKKILGYKSALQYRVQF